MKHDGLTRKFGAQDDDQQSGEHDSLMADLQFTNVTENK